MYIYVDAKYILLHFLQNEVMYIYLRVRSSINT